MKHIFYLLFLSLPLLAQQPTLYTDLPDPSMIRVGDTYYMSATTMHMNPGVPILASKDLSNWKMISYAYPILEEGEVYELKEGRNMYSKGSWASSLRYHQGKYYLSTFSHTSGKTYIFITDSLESGKWEVKSFAPALHDHTLFFDDVGKAHMIYGGGKLKMVQLKDDLSGLLPGEKVLIENATAPIGNSYILHAEGSQLFKHEGKYYLFNIAWPRGGMRTVIVHRADSLDGPWEGRVAFQDLGVAQGGLIDTPDGRWFAYLFRDMGAVGRVPYWVPVVWQDGWPVLGEQGKVPAKLDLPAFKGLAPGIVADDDFSRGDGQADWPLVWQWNHNPDPEHWSLSERKGFFRLRAGRKDASVLQARNTLTQRTFGPESGAEVRLELQGLKEGDRAGLLALQSDYGWIGVKVKDGQKVLVIETAEDNKVQEKWTLPWTEGQVHLRIHCDFRELKDLATFSYSLDGRTWISPAVSLPMKYKLTHFMGYRFGLFMYATQETGGYADFDYFKLFMP